MRLGLRAMSDGFRITTNVHRVHGLVCAIISALSFSGVFFDKVRALRLIHCYL